jgi:hypothetical protein
VYRLDNITRELLTSGTLRRYIDEFSITGLTSNPTIFDLAIRNGNSYDDSIRQRTAQRESGEDLFFELAFEDLHQAADLFRPIYDSTHGIDGFRHGNCLRVKVSNIGTAFCRLKSPHGRGRRSVNIWLGSAARIRRIGRSCCVRLKTTTCDASARRSFRVCRASIADRQVDSHGVSGLLVLNSEDGDKDT